MSVAPLSNSSSRPAGESSSGALHLETDELKDLVFGMRDLMVDVSMQLEDLMREFGHQQQKQSNTQRQLDKAKFEIGRLQLERSDMIRRISVLERGVSDLLPVRAAAGSPQPSPSPRRPISHLEENAQVLARSADRVRELSALIEQK